MVNQAAVILLGILAIAIIVALVAAYYPKLFSNQEVETGHVPSQMSGKMSWVDADDEYEGHDAARIVQSPQQRLRETVQFLQKGDRYQSQDEQDEVADGSIWDPMLDRATLSQKQREEFDQSEQNQSATKYLPQTLAAQLAETCPERFAQPVMQPQEAATAALSGMLAQNFDNDLVDDDEDLDAQREAMQVDGHGLGMWMSTSQVDFVDRKTVGNSNKKHLGQRLDEYLRPDSSTDVQFDLGARMPFNTTDAHEQARDQLRQRRQ